LIPLLCEFSNLLKKNDDLLQKRQQPSFKDHLNNIIHSDI
jgi:hypothetical protein